MVGPKGRVSLVVGTVLTGNSKKKIRRIVKIFETVGFKIQRFFTLKRSFGSRYSIDCCC